MRKVISIFMAFFIMLGSLASTGCSKIAENETANNTTVEGVSNTKDEGESNTTDESANVLDGKKIIFIGSSSTHYGNCVIRKDQAIQSQQQRSDDLGYFFQLCNKNGARVSVTNWCYGGHSPADLFEVCSANRGCDGVVHQNDLVDRNFDYVVLQHAPGCSIAKFTET